jgi:broad specificity phosphatase PhoE
MSLPKRITLIRHGESVWNAAGRWQGHGDAPLSEVGQQQALALGRRLRGHTFARIESSDLQRAVDTARAFGSPVQASIWRELDVGLWEGLSDAEVREQFPEELQALRKDPTQKWGRHGESLEDLRKRARQAFDALVARLAPGEEAAVVCHGGLLLSLVTDLLGMPDRFPRPIGRFGNTSITCIEVGGRGPRLLTLNDVAHVAEAPARTRDGAPAVCVTGAEAEAAARSILGDAPLAPALPGHRAHVVEHPHGRVLWDWNVMPDGSGA